jgi:hypothetical protein
MSEFGNIGTGPHLDVLILVVLAMWSCTAIAQVSDPIFQDRFEFPQLVQYPDSRVHSPISKTIADAWRGTKDISGQVRPNVFMKAGDGKLVSTHALHCFSGSEIELGSFSDLQSTLDFFSAGDAAGSTPYERSSIAAETGRFASWVVSGNPSPLQQEADALIPEIALVAFGENDASLLSLSSYAQPLLQAVDELLDRSVIPVIVSPGPCQSCAGGPDRIERFRQMARAVAQARQVYFIDLHLALQELPDFGLAVDGVHPNVYSPDGPMACNFTSAGLEFGYNMLNLVVLQALSRIRSVFDQPDGVPDPEANVRLGHGSVQAPFHVTSLPYASSGLITEQGLDEVDSFSACLQDGATSGPEHVYRLDFEGPGTLQIEVVSNQPADIDAWLFRDDTEGTSCVQFINQSIERSVSAGTWFIVLEAFDDMGTVRHGEYVMTVDLVD